MQYMQLPFLLLTVCTPERAVLVRKVHMRQHAFFALNAVIVVVRRA